MAKRGKSKRSSGEGWILVRACPVCGQTECRCERQREPAPGEKPTVRLRLEKRRGKPVTVALVSGVAADARKALARELKALCASGGTLKGDEIELQGDHRERLREALGAKGMTVRG